MQSKSFFWIKKINVYKIDQEAFNSIPGLPIAYWIPEEQLSLFENAKMLSYFAKPKQGLATADNNRFLRNWYEIDHAKFLC